MKLNDKMGLNKITLALVLSVALVGCANIDDSYRTTEENFQQYEAIAKQYNVNEDWWTLYQDPNLNHLVEQALRNNKDLAKSAINVNRALYRANLLGANLVPAFNGSTTSSASKDLNDNGTNPTRSQGVSSTGHSATLGVSYTLDLWRRLADSADAGAWQHKATIEDLATARLSLINSVVSTYYQLAYLNDAIATTQDSIKYYNQINTVMTNKFRYGVANAENIDQAKQAVLSARNNLIRYQTEQKIAEQTLRNLLNLTPTDPLNVHYPKILAVKLAGVNLNVPVSTIANRPDVKAYEYRLRSAFKDAKATQKSWFPSITLGGSINAAGSKVSNALDAPYMSGVVNISLPFLNWNAVKWNVKISEADYETAKLNFEQSITKSLNEIDANYFVYKQSNLHFENLKQKYNYDRRISRYYQNRYNAGIAELREWLTALNTEKVSQLGILNAKYSLIQAENAVYSSMGGYHSTAR